MFLTAKWLTIQRGCHFNRFPVRWIFFLLRVDPCIYMRILNCRTCTNILDDRIRKTKKNHKKLPLRQLFSRYSKFWTFLVIHSVPVWGVRSVKWHINLAESKVADRQTKSVSPRHLKWSNLRILNILEIFCWFLSFN